MKCPRCGTQYIKSDVKVSFLDSKVFTIHAWCDDCQTVMIFEVTQGMLNQAWLDLDVGGLYPTGIQAMGAIGGTPNVK